MFFRLMSSSWKKFQPLCNSGFLQASSLNGNLGISDTLVNSWMLIDCSYSAVHVYSIPRIS